MILRKSTFVLNAVTTVAMLLALVPLSRGQSISVGGTIQFSGTGGSTSASIRAGNISGNATVIGDGTGGFTMYSKQGTSRYLGKSQGNRVYHPDGSSSLVIDDPAGGKIIYGPQGTHRVSPAPNPRLNEEP